MFCDIDWNLCLDSFYWSYENLCYLVLIEVDLFKLEFCYNKKRDEFRSIVRCERCNFVVYVEDWNQKCASYHENSWKVHVQKSPQCFLITRFLADLKKREQTRIAKKQKETRLTIFACRRCSAKFSSNIKLHQHIQNHHQKSTKSADEIAKSTSSELAKIISNEIATFTISASTSKAVIAMSTFFATFSSSSESALMLTSFVSHSESIFIFSFFLISFATSNATSRKSIFWVEIVSRSVKASVVCSFTSSSIFSQKSVSKHQHQKFYFTIQDLFEMFDEKLKRTDFLHIKQHIKKIECSLKIFNQSKIIFYFRFAVNQSKSISQSSKTSNSRNFQQHMSAESNRVKFIFIKWFEKSIILSYKTSIFSRLSISEISDISSYKMSSISRFQSMIAFCKFTIRLSVSSISRVSLNISDSRHVCRICSDTFESNNCLHRHLRAIHFDHASRHEFEKHQALERNIMTWRFLIFWRRNRSFFYFFSCITIRFLEEWIACSRHTTQRERCDLFSLMTSVTVNLHIELKSKYFDKNELAFWRFGQYLAFCLLESNNSIILSITLLFNTFYRNTIRFYRVSNRCFRINWKNRNFELSFYKNIYNLNFKIASSSRRKENCRCVF